MYLTRRQYRDTHTTSGMIMSPPSTSDYQDVCESVGYSAISLEQKAERRSKPANLTHGLSCSGGQDTTSLTGDTVVPGKSLL